MLSIATWVVSIETSRPSLCLSIWFKQLCFLLTASFICRQAWFDPIWSTLLCCGTVIIDMPAVTRGMAFVLRRKKRAIRMMAIVVLLFAACWAPFHLVSLLLDYGNIKYFELFSLLCYCTGNDPSFSVLHKVSTTNNFHICESFRFFILPACPFCEDIFFSAFSAGTIIAEKYREY